MCVDCSRSPGTCFLEFELELELVVEALLAATLLFFLASQIDVTSTHSGALAVFLYFAVFSFPSFFALQYTHTHTHWHTCKQTERVKTSERQLTDRLHGRHILVVVVAGETAVKEGQIEEEGIEPTAIASANSRQAAAAANRSESS